MEPLARRNPRWTVEVIEVIEVAEGLSERLRDLEEKEEEEEEETRCETVEEPSISSSRKSVSFLVINLIVMMMNDN